MATRLKSAAPGVISDLHQLVDPDRGSINSRVFNDPAIYQQELPSDLHEDLVLCRSRVAD